VQANPLWGQVGINWLKIKIVRVFSVFRG